MVKRFLKRIRKIRLLFSLVALTLTILSFQNCAPQKKTCDSKTTNCKEDSASNASTGGNTSGNSGGSSVWGGRPSGSGGVGIGGGGSSSGGGSGGGTGGGIVIGGGGGGGGSGGGGGGGGGTGTDTTFRIVKQPATTSVNEKTSFTLSVSVTGGTYPYSYQWFKDGQAISNGAGTFEMFSDTANTYTVEGNYHVIIKDGAGRSLQSAVARVTIQEIAGNCDAGSYFTFTSPDYDVAYKYIPDYFASTRGKYLLHKSYDTQGFIYNYRNYSGLHEYNVPTTLAYLDKTFISCRSAIPRIHEPQQNPAYNHEWGYYARFDDGGNYKYEGSVTFECRNKKIKFISNTCNWVHTPPPADSGGNYGGGY
ncbi:MAG: hypothetical protein HUU57_01630 [Bdellovibrio sp.]|nr:hypothetical protein [Bdellovibrio sp.]